MIMHGLVRIRVWGFVACERQCVGRDTDGFGTGFAGLNKAIWRSHVIAVIARDRRDRKSGTQFVVVAVPVPNEPRGQELAARSCSSHILSRSRRRRSLRAKSMIAATISAYERPDFFTAMKNSELLESQGLGLASIT
jgi:hypothetical protein